MAQQQDRAAHTDPAAESNKERTDGIWLGLQKGVENSDPKARSPGEDRTPSAKNAKQCSPLRVANGSL